ncbi:MAG: ThiF family adenylyltransferase [Fimbriimonadaceae bacterium]|nr:ThiF family adenylyltransferase [Fimbriimonadaceae bacterium]
METSLESQFADLGAAARKQARISLGGHFELESVPIELPGYVESWRVKVATKRADHLTISVTAQFPFELPTVFVEKNLFGVVPHIDQRGELCYCDKATSTYDPLDIGDVVLWVVERACCVLNADDERVMSDEFASEFQSYWKAPEHFLCLLDDFKTTREVELIWLDRKYSGGYSFLACNEAEVGIRWLKQSGIGVPTVRGKALFVPNVIPPKPPYPQTNGALFELLLTHPKEIRTRWESFVRKEGRSTLILSTVSSSRGEALLAWRHTRLPPNYSKPSQNTVNGFRPGKHPIAMEMRGWGANAQLTRFRGDRVDLTRLVHRTTGSQTEPGFKHLVIIGVGSIGSHLLLALAKSHHFERMMLIDPELLKVENVLRHAAGFDQVSRPKAKVMGELIGRHCPWATIEFIEGDILNNIQSLPELAETADLFVLATGNEVIEKAVIPLIMKLCQPRTAIHRVWLTTNAEKGQLVRFVVGEKGCPDCDEEIHEPRNPGSIIYEPGCSAGFGQFGGSRLQRFVALCCDAILKPVDSPYRLKWTARPQEETSEQDGVEIEDIMRVEACARCGE